MHAQKSLAESLAWLSASDRIAALQGLSNEQAQALLWDWGFWARPEQLAPDGNWRIWLILAGRGFGKTRSGAEWVRAQVVSGRRGRIALVGRTAADVRDVMVEGESGILACSPPHCKPIYEPSKRRITWPNGAIATTYSADEPDLLRGPQHDAAWGDELPAWKYPEKTWDNLMMGLRLGNDPRAVVTTTPRPIPIIRSMLADPTVATTRGSTYDNRANLAPTFFSQIIKQYEGTRLGRQELLAEILDDTPGAIWHLPMIDATRVSATPDLVRVVVAIDPAVTSGDDADETGIVVVGLGTDGHCYVLDDCTLVAHPSDWAKAAIAAYRKHCGDRIIAEVNNGGDLVETVIHAVDPDIPYRKVHASRGKQTRAEPVAALYEQRKVHHVGCFPKLEDQMCHWVPGQSGKRASPDRMDAMVWAVTELMGIGQPQMTETMVYWEEDYSISPI